MIVEILPSWVESDPLRSRATDALGLQAVADRLADRLLPGLSVLTTRARYFTFLAWARQRIGDKYDERAIHQREVALTLAEATISDGNPTHKQNCSYVGALNVGSKSAQEFPRDRVPRDPRRAYKIPAWRAYRASMIDLGLITGGPHFSLTEKGFEAATRFRTAARPRGNASRPLTSKACLSLISASECRVMRDLLGLSVRGRFKDNPQDRRLRRSAFAREVRDIYWRDGGLRPETLLPRYEAVRKASLAEPAATLRRAVVWERLSLGLNVLFTAWVRGVEQARYQAVEHKIERVLMSGIPCPSLESVELGEEDRALAKAVACLRDAVRSYNDLTDRGIALPDRDAFETARALLNSRHRPRSRVQEGIQRLRVRHQQAKGDDGWFRETGRGRFELARESGDKWRVPTVVRLHAYRISAFANIANDLGGI